MLSQRMNGETTSVMRCKSILNGRLPCRKTLLQTAIVASLAFSQVIRAGWIDMDTPLDKRTTKSFVDGTTYQLVCIVFKRGLAHCGEPVLTSVY
jgi:hypothetical protein